jgi:methionyl-tRNA synthetase
MSSAEESFEEFEDSESSFELLKENERIAKKATMYGRCQICKQFVSKRSVTKHLQQCLSDNASPDNVLIVLH